MGKGAPIRDHDDLDLVDWTRVARAVIEADFSLRHGADYRIEPSEAAQSAVLNCIQEHKDAECLRTAGFTSIGGFWCRVERGEIATYTRESALKRLEMADALLRAGDAMAGKEHA